MTTSPFDQVRPPEPERRGEKRRRRRGGDPNATVPEATFTSYYGRNIVKAPPWKKEIPVYLFLGGVAGASGLISAGAHMTGRDSTRARMRVAAVASAAAGGAALVADLGRPERFHHMMRTMKLTSPMSVGSWILAGFSGCAGLGVALEASRLVVPDESPLALIRRLLDPPASVGTAFFSPPLAAYTAVLLSDTAMPLWNQSYRELPFVFVCSATGAGSGLTMVLCPPEETRPVRQIATIAAAGKLVADALLSRRLGEEGQPLHEGRPHTLHRAAQALTVAGGLAAAFAGRRRSVAVLSGLALLAGSACTRFAVFEAGMDSAKDPVYTVRPQRKRVDAKRALGQSVTDPGGPWPR